VKGRRGRRRKQSLNYIEKKSRWCKLKEKTRGRSLCCGEIDLEEAMDLSQDRLRNNDEA